MNSEIKRLEMRIKLGSGDEELDLVQCAALRDLMNAYESQVTTLTAERDEARKELAALKSAPGMEEVDALCTKWNDPGPWESEVVEEALREFTDIARRSIIAREEEKQRADACRVNMFQAEQERDEARAKLDHILSCIITVRQENTPEWMEYIVEEVNKVNEAMGDPDRVALSFGGIVIAKGETPNAD